MEESVGSVKAKEAPAEALPLTSCISQTSAYAEEIDFSMSLHIPHSITDKQQIKLHKCVTVNLAREQIRRAGKILEY